MKKITIIIPLYNEEESLPHFYGPLTTVAEKLEKKYNVDFLFVDDGSTDSSRNVLKELRKVDKRIRIIGFSRNFGKESAMLAGLDHIDSDAAVLIDADLQHPPEIILEFVKKWEEGYLDVYAERTDRNGESMIRRAFAGMYYSYLDKSVRHQVYRDIGDFRLLDRRCIDALKQVREDNRSTKNILSWIGFKKASVPYEVAPRVSGVAKFNFSKLATLAMDGFTAFTTAPLTIAGYAGAVSIIAGVIMLISRAILVGIDAMDTVIVLILIIGGANLVAMSIVGAYLGRAFIEVKKRPLYLIEEEI